MNDKPQVDKFRDLARQFEADEDDGRFNERLKRPAEANMPRSSPEPKPKKKA